MNTVVNIDSPHPLWGIKNEDVINYIEPLRANGYVEVSSAYLFNLNEYNNKRPPCIRPGFKYMFWFTDELEAEKFRVTFNGQFVPLNTENTGG